MIHDKTLKQKVSAPEWIFLRFTYSIYGGWITAASILNISFLIKALGLLGEVDGNKEEELFFYSAIFFVVGLFTI
jgi:hypothetical protein